MAGDWSPGAGGADWLLLPQWVYDEPVPDYPVTVPNGNGMPELVPYRYRGTDFTEPGELDVTSRAQPRPVVREATRWDDPTLRYAGLPFSRPINWEAS